MYAFPFSLMYLLFCTDFYSFRNFVFFVFLVVQYRRSVIYKIKRLDTNTRDFGYKGIEIRSAHSRISLAEILSRPIALDLDNLFKRDY